VFYKGKTITLKDSYSLINSALAQFPEIFGLKGIQKEIFPYNLYTIDRLKEGVADIENAWQYEARSWTEEDIIRFNENIKHCQSDLPERKFDLWKYAEFYCQQDVDVLRQGFQIFRQGLKDDFDVDAIDFISNCSIAYEVLKKKVFYPNGNVYELGGVVQKFCQQSIRGGRCMTAHNEKHHTQVPIEDFDAVSLYPSAMTRIPIISGKPKIITDTNYEELRKISTAFVVDIEILSVKKHYAFPLISLPNKEGIIEWTDDEEKVVGKVITVNHITLEDLINFQQIEFKIIRGYYWDGKEDYAIRDLIEFLFNKRAEYKKDKNPFQTIIKLLMNSMYGKSIQKEIDTELRFIPSKETEKYWVKNYYRIEEANKIPNSKLHCFKIKKPIDDHFNNVLFGSMVLAMSKRIMNEVMCLAEDIGCKIYYQDTDSLHIERTDLSKLEKAFEEKYGRKLVGKNLGQFHSDFASRDERDDVEYACESFFICKKLYCDMLLMKNGTTNIMYRGKGITKQSMELTSLRLFQKLPKDATHPTAPPIEQALKKLYEKLYEGETISFDLCEGRAQFKFNPDFTVSTLHSFVRCLNKNDCLEA
jgi:hypothetical protein